MLSLNEINIVVLKRKLIKYIKKNVCEKEMDRGVFENIWFEKVLFVFSLGELIKYIMDFV